MLEFVYSDLYQPNYKLCEQLSKFGEMRNKIAHCYFTWDESNLSYVTIWDLADRKVKPHKVVPTKYQIQEISDLLTESKEL